MGDVPNRHTGSRPASPGHGRAFSPALREFVRLLAKVAVEKYLDEAAVGVEQQDLESDQRTGGTCQSSTDTTPTDLNKPAFPNTGSSIQEGRSHG